MSLQTSRPYRKILVRTGLEIGVDGFAHMPGYSWDGQSDSEIYRSMDFCIDDFFGPAQAILANPEFQSQKFLFVMGQLEPLPHTAGSWWILPAAILAIGVLYGIVYHFVRRAFPKKPWWKKGVQFGLVAWALMVPWFEIYLPWNVMHEPAILVAFEMALWMAVLVCTGMAIAGVYEWQDVEVGEVT